jgi:hypothetical protein
MFVSSFFFFFLFLFFSFPSSCYLPSVGNGIWLNGSNVVGNDPTDSAMVKDTQWQLDYIGIPLFPTFSTSFVFIYSLLN